MSNYPDGTHDSSAGAPWNEPDLDIASAQRAACDSKCGDSGEWIAEWLAESDHLASRPAADLSGPASTVELLSILFRQPTARQQAACIAALRERYLAYVEPLVNKLANEALVAA